MACATQDGAAAGLYKNKATTMQDGHIDRRMAFRNAASQEEAEEELEKQKVSSFLLPYRVPIGLLCLLLLQHYKFVHPQKRTDMGVSAL